MISAFFDVDGTIVKGHTAVMLGKIFLKKGKINPLFFISKLIYYTILYKTHKLNYEGLLLVASRKISGMRVEELYKLGKECFEKEVKNKIFKEVVELIKWHKEEGQVTVLATSAPKFIVEYLKEFLKIDYAILQDIVVKDGIITEEIIEPSCYGEGKKLLVEKFAQENNISLKESYFYTDNYSDLSTLLIVGHPIVINPDKKLLKEAKKRDWQIKYFS